LTPLEIEILASDKFLFTVPQCSHVERILHQGPWNVQGSLLILKPWSPKLTFEEAELHICPFWIQVHGVPLQSMTALGTLLEVENGEVPCIICRHHLRIKVEIDTLKPLVPGFHFSRLGRDPIWVRFLYQRLADYCILCGLIGHKKNGCLAPLLLLPHEKYGLSLMATIFSSPRSSSGFQVAANEMGKSEVGKSPFIPVIPPLEAFSATNNGDELVQLQLVT